MRGAEGEESPDPFPEISARHRPVRGLTLGFAHLRVELTLQLPLAVIAVGVLEEGRNCDEDADNEYKGS